MTDPSESILRRQISTLVSKLTQIEKDLAQVIRRSRNPTLLSTYEAHAFVRQAINALSKDMEPKTSCD